MRTRVAAFYRFSEVADPSAFREDLQPVAREAGVVGTILVAAEGVNGTIAGSDEAVESVLDWLRAHGFGGLTPRDSWADKVPFYRLKVRLKKEIVALGVEAVDPNQQVGIYVGPAEWDALLEDPEVVVLDVRNDYEVGIGTFTGAVDPGLERFGDFPAFVDAHPELLRRKVAMFCTGGIRCEKASSWMLREGAAEVFHLQGGILRYLKEVPETASRWEGQCFVFDERVSVGHGLIPGELENCRGCRQPLIPEALQDPRFEPGVRCGRCGEVDEATLARRRERALQMKLAQARGERHIGLRRVPTDSGG